MVNPPGTRILAVPLTKKPLGLYMPWQITAASAAPRGRFLPFRSSRCAVTYADVSSWFIGRLARRLSQTEPELFSRRRLLQHARHLLFPAHSRTARQRYFVSTAASCSGVASICFRLRNVQTPLLHSGRRGWASSAGPSVAVPDDRAVGIGAMAACAPRLTTRPRT